MHDQVSCAVHSILGAMGLCSQTSPSAGLRAVGLDSAKSKQTRAMSSSGPVRLPPRKRRPTADSLSGIFAVCLTSALLAGIYFGREVLVPFALAALITFLLTPLVNKLQRWLGNIAAVLA